jgi:hypothetical protein
VVSGLVLENFLQQMGDRLRLARGALQRVVRAIDPCDDDEAEPLGLLPLLALLVAILTSLWMFFRWKYMPMQDLGHHVALSAVVADYGRPGSLYTPLYEPIDPIAANSLLYQLAGRIGRWIGVTSAVRGCIGFYLAGVPLANLYALRVFGRSAWPAVIAVPLAYNMNFVAGFANLLFAAPLMVLALPLFYRSLERVSLARTAGVALLFAALFLGHAHLYLWTGALCFVLSLVLVARAMARGLVRNEPVAALRDAGRVVLAALGAVVPSLLLFAHWYARTFGEGRNEGGIANATSGWTDHFGAYFRTTRELLAALPDTFEVFRDQADMELVVKLLALTALAVVLARLHRFRRPPVMEAAFAVTFLSYLFLPDGLKGHDIIAARQPGIALWLLPALLSPVPARVSRAARWVVIGLSLLLTREMLRTWYDALVQFETAEAAGLADVMSSAPPRLRLHYVKLDPTSEVFTWKPFWHVEKIYMGDGFGQAADTPGILSTSAIRYRSDVDIHRVATHHNWVSNEEIWKNFDLVLVRRWKPTSAELSEAQKHGSRLRVSGDWELWRSREALPPEASH